MEISRYVQELRTNWALGDARRDAGLTTPDDIIRFDNISYGTHGADNLLDIYVPKGTTALQPTIVNIHGGGWIYGNKEIYQHFGCQLYHQTTASNGITRYNLIWIPDWADSPTEVQVR